MDFSAKEKVIVVANRLPMTVKKDDDGKWTYTPSSGGLASALTGLKKKLDFIWIGWPGVDVPAAEQQNVSSELVAKHSCMPVFLSQEIVHSFYSGFSNSIMWPLLHYLSAEVDFEEDQWIAYQQANAEFTKAVLAIVSHSDCIWVHDYQLMLVPKMLRECLAAQKIDAAIGFFLHTPFSSSELCRVLPVRKEILSGVLSADLVGFHTYEYARHFLDSCTRILRVKTRIDGVEFNGKACSHTSFPNWH